MKASKAQAIAVSASIAFAFGAIIASSSTAGASSIDPDALFPQLEREASPADALPSSADLAPHGIVEDSSRFLGSDETGRHWVALNTDGEVCLVTALEGPGEVFGSSCASRLNAYEAGLALSVGGESNARTSTAYLIPADVDTSSLQTSTMQSQRTQVGASEASLLMVSSSDDLAEAELPRETSNKPFIFTPLSE